MIVAQAGLMHTPWVGALVVLVALLLTRISGYLDRKGHMASNSSAPVHEC